MDLRIGIGSILLFLLISSVQPSYGQECGEIPNKKASKLLEKAKEDRSLDLVERIDLINRSLEADPGCIECLFTKARAEYALAAERNISYDRAYNNFSEITSRCPEYHADAFYYAGIIAYGNQDYGQATEYFESFLGFDTEKGKSSRDHDEKISDVLSVLPETKFYDAFYSNPVAFNPRRLGNINTMADEYLPMLSPDNELIFFTRKSREKAKGDLYAREVERFMMAEKAAVNDFKQGTPLPPPFNVGDNYGGVSLSVDNREMFVTVCKPISSSYKNCDIYVTKYERSTDESGQVSFQWSGLENLGPAVNTESGWEAQPTLSADGNTLYFATIRENTTPDEEGNPTIDIYYSERSADDTWKTAKPVGNGINTKGNDKSPFLHADSRTLYFSSNGHLGAGGYDIFFSKQSPEGVWAEPKNIGYPVNSPQDEHGLVVSTDGNTALFASSNVSSAKGLDVFAFDVPKKAKPEKVLLLKGEVKNEKGEVVNDARIELKYTETKEVQEIEVDEVDGTYAAVLNLSKDEDVVVSIKSQTEDLAFNSRVFTIADTVEAVKDLSMAVENLKPGQTYRMNDIRFATNASELNESSKSVLVEFAEYLNENEEYSIEIYGHTDDIGNENENLILSTDRAFEVFGFLQDSGVAGARMTFKGFGESKPLVPNTSPENRSINRRTEFRINPR